MSVEVELNGKGGRVCEQGRCGTIHCPLIVRPTSEDVLTGNVFGLLKHIRPHLWVNTMLNQALDGNPNSGRFRQVWLKDFSIRFWERQARFPPEMLDFKEGRTEPDVILEWENPATTVWIEAKYRSDFARGTNNSDDNDQVIRGIRTLLVDTGHIRPVRLFHMPRRRAIWISVTANEREPLVDGIVNSHTYEDLHAEHGWEPDALLLGHVGWQQLADATHPGNWIESRVIRSVRRYIAHKVPHEVRERM